MENRKIEKARPAAVVARRAAVAGTGKGEAGGVPVGARLHILVAITGLVDPVMESAVRALRPLLASFRTGVFGAFRCFATRSEASILHGLLGAGMGQDPALALLPAESSLSRPTMPVIRSAMGRMKSIVFAGLAVVMATVTEIAFGVFA